MGAAKIEAFIRRHHVITLATVAPAATAATDLAGTSPGDAALGSAPDSEAGGWQPWCAHAFYAWVAAPGGDGAVASDGEWRGGSFVFTTAEGTRHGAEMAANQRVAAAIALETRVVGRLQGLQIEGTVHRPEGAELTAARRAYLRRFPYAAAMPDLELWTLSPSLMKLTDNTLGFGKKLIVRGNVVE
jgi:uncharacterized protein YhbP (UPF0306 family)